MRMPDPDSLDLSPGHAVPRDGWYKSKLQTASDLFVFSADYNLIPLVLFNVLKSLSILRWQGISVIFPRVTQFIISKQFYNIMQIFKCRFPDFHHETSPLCM